jgi:membrane fusion protein (multidrug efflux system)
MGGCDKEGTVKNYGVFRGGRVTGWFILLLVSGVIAATFCGCGKRKEAASQAPPVEVAEVVQRDVPVILEWVAATDGSVNASIRPQVSGYLIKQNYKEGDFVRKGQVLFQIDPRLFQAALEQAQGQLAQQQASWTTAKANLDRIKPLAAQNAVSRKDLDDATGQEQSAYASVLSARAAVDKAKLDLGFTRVTSLIDGVAGIAKAQIGDLVGSSQATELTTVSTVDPIKVYVPVSEQQYLKATEGGRNKTSKSVLELVLSDGSVYPHTGEFTFADRQVDPSTGTIKIASLFPNPNNLLRPGQFAKVRARIATRKGALLVPQRAVTELQGSYLVAVVGPGNKIDMRPVEVGERVDSLWVISKGLKPGEKVVVEGGQKVKQGMPVIPKLFVPQASAGAGPSGQGVAGATAPPAAGKR